MQELRNYELMIHAVVHMRLMSIWLPESMRRNDLDTSRRELLRADNLLLWQRERAFLLLSSNFERVLQIGVLILMRDSSGNFPENGFREIRLYIRLIENFEQDPCYPPCNLFNSSARVLS